MARGPRHFGRSKRNNEENEEEYVIEWIDDDDDDDIPEGCSACGGPYPHCTSSCPLFDD